MPAAPTTRRQRQDRTGNRQTHRALVAGSGASGMGLDVDRRHLHGFGKRPAGTTAMHVLVGSSVLIIQPAAFRLALCTSCRNMDFVPLPGMQRSRPCFSPTELAVLQRSMRMVVRRSRSGTAAARGLWYEHASPVPRLGAANGVARRRRCRAVDRRYRQSVSPAKGWWISLRDRTPRGRRASWGSWHLNYSGALLERSYHRHRKLRISGRANQRLPERPDIAAYLLAVALREAHTRELAGYAAVDSPRRAVQAVQDIGGAQVVEVVVSRGEALRRSQQHIELIKALVPRAAQDDGAEASQRCRKMVDAYYNERDVPTA